MSKKNYTNYNLHEGNYQNKPQQMDVTSIEEVAVEEPVVEEPVVEEKVEDAVKKPAKPAVGIVEGCNRLRVRKTPSVNGEVVAIILTQSKVKVFKEDSTAEWYKVRTAEGHEGYCMKKFITVK